MEIRLGLQVIAPYVLAVLAVVFVVSGLILARRRNLEAWLVTLSPKADAADAATRLAVLFAFAVVSLLAACELAACLGFFAGLRVSVFDFLLAAVVCVAGTLLAAKSFFPQRPRSAAWAVLMFLAAVFSLFTVASGWFYDASWDGNTTPQVVMVELRDGWNPISAPAALTDRHEQGLAIETYSKGAWIRDAVVYQLTGRLEQAKVNNLLLILAGLAAWLALLLPIDPTRPRVAAVGGLIAALNPIGIQQSLTFLVDGQVSSLIVLFVALAGLLFTEFGTVPVLVATAAVLAMLATVKFTSLVFAVVLVAGLALAVMIRHTSLKRRLVLSYLAAGLAVGVFVMGFNPYVINTVKHGSPFYPLVGRNSIDIMSPIQPANFTHKGSLERLTLSLFSRSEDFGNVTRLKVPFLLYPAEIRPFLGFQTPVGGFGPWFSGALLLALLSGMLVLADPQTRSDRVVLWASFACGVILVSVLANPQSWWARYSPQLWLVPVIIGLTTVYRSSRKRTRALGYGLCAVLLLNAAFVGMINFASVAHARQEIGARLDEAAAWPRGVVLQQGAFEESWVKFAERGIPYTIVSDETTIPGGTAIPYLPAVIARQR